MAGGYLTQDSFYRAQENVLFNNMKQAVEGECCVTSRKVYSFYRRRLVEKPRGEESQKRSLGLAVGFHELWRWFMHLSCLKNPNFAVVLKQALYNKIIGLFLGDGDVLDVINGTVLCMFHDGFLKKGDREWAQKCVKQFLSSDDPLSVLQDIEPEALSFGLERIQPTFSPGVIQHVATCIQFDW